MTCEAITNCFIRPGFKLVDANVTEIIAEQENSELDNLIKSTKELLIVKEPKIIDAFINFDNDACHGKCFNGDFVNQNIENNYIINISSDEEKIESQINQKEEEIEIQVPSYNEAIDMIKSLKVFTMNKETSLYNDISNLEITFCQLQLSKNNSKRQNSITDYFK